MNRLLLAATGVVAACSTPVDQAFDVISVDLAPIVVESVVHRVPYSLTDELAIVHLADLVSTETGYALSHTGHEVLLLDPDLRLVRRIGREGSGPGEFRLPNDLEAHPEGLAVLDSGNNRVVVLGEDSGVLQNLVGGSGNPDDIAVLPSGEVVFPLHRDPTGLAILTDEGLRPVGALEGTERLGRGSMGARAYVRGPLVAGPDGRIHYYDNAGRVVETFSAGGSPERRLGFGASLTRQIEDDAATAAEAFGEDAVVSFSYVLNMSLLGDRPVLVAPSLPGVDFIGLVLEPVGTSARHFTLAPGLAGVESSRAGSAVAFRGDVMTVADGDGLTQYRIRFPPDMAR